MEMNQPSEEVIRAVIKDRNWKLSDLRVGQDLLNKSVSPACSLWTLQDQHIPGAALVRFAVMADGKLIARTGDMGGLTRVLRECLSADAETWAQAVAGYIDATSPKVIREGDVSYVKELRAAGVGDATPALRMLGDDSELRFVMARGDGRTIRVLALVPKDGPVQVTQTPVAR